MAPSGVVISVYDFPGQGHLIPENRYQGQLGFNAMDFRPDQPTSPRVKSHSESVSFQKTLYDKNTPLPFLEGGKKKNNPIQ